MNLSVLARFIAYMVAVGLGIFMTVYGVFNADTALVTTGLALVTTGGLASVNTPIKSKHGD